MFPAVGEIVVGAGPALTDIEGLLNGVSPLADEIDIVIPEVPTGGSVDEGGDGGPGPLAVGFTGEAAPDELAEG